ncbi:MAG: GNAT family N-acetyltransferase [Rhodospirillaceae bacterium]|nr:GNAT family N-acetyltransferase [Rhodospirillaceae bacterium]
MCALDGEEAMSALAEVFTWRTPQILGYHHPAYQHLMTSLLDDALCCLAVRSAGRLRGLMPFRRKVSRHGTVMNALPFFGCNGLAVTDDAEVLPPLLQAFAALARTENVFSAALYTPFGVDATSWCALLRPDDVITKFTQYLDLSGVRAWPAKRQADVRRAAARGYTVQPAVPADAAEIMALYEAVCAETGIPMKPRAFIDGTLDIAARFADAAPMRWLTARREGKIAAALLYGLGLETASYILPCAAADERAFQPNALLMDAAVADARAHGIRYWNFESSPVWNDAVFKYKERWGACATSFALMMFYGRAGTASSPLAVNEVRADCPYYFVAPVGRVGGTWPTDAPLTPWLSGPVRQ